MRQHMRLMARPAPIVAALAAALALAGCGGSSSGSGNALEVELSFVPKDAPLVGTLATDPDGGQWKQLDELAGKFPFTGQLKTRFKQAINQSSGLDFDTDIKPILGNDAVIAAPTPAALRQGGN